jgi:DNA polymerase-3 subunit epsilon
VTDNSGEPRENAEFDHDTVVRHARRDGLDPGHLADTSRWSCLMNRRTAWLMRHRWLPLGGGHRAREDCQVAFDLLASMTAPAHQPKPMRR